MARARLNHFTFAPQSATNPDLRVSGGVAVVVLEIDGTTPFAGTLYAQPAGGAVILPDALITNSAGLVDVYTAAEDARRVKLDVDGLASLVDSEFRIDPVDAMTLSTVQTVSGLKTITSPIINTPTINTPTINTPVINTPTIYTPTFSYAALTEALLMRQQINAKEFGVLANGTDQTSRINEFFNVFRSMGDSILVPGEGMDLYFPSGKYSVGKINATKADRVNLFGVPDGTVFFADQMASPGVCWDFSGSSNNRIIGISVAGAVYGSGTAPANIPTAGFLFCDTSVTTGNSNANYLEHIGGYGFFTAGHIYLYNTADSTFVWCHANMDSSPGVPTVYITSSNGATVTSAFQTVNPAPNFTGNITLVNYGGSGLHMDGVSNINFFGGSIDGTTFGKCVRFSGTLNERVGFYNTQFTCNHVSNPTAFDTSEGAITVATGTCRSLQIHNPFMNTLLKAASSQAFIRGAEDALFPDLHIIGVNPAEAATTEYIMRNTAATPTSTVTIDGGFIDCGRMAFNPGGTMNGVQVNNVGTYTRESGADEPDCLFIRASVGSGFPSGGSGFVLQNSAIRGGNGSASAPTFSFTADPNSGMLSGGADIVHYVANGVVQSAHSVSGLLPRRIVATSVAAALVTGNFASLSVSWGTTATVSAVTGTEVSGTFTITSSGTGQGASPTVTFTYTGGAYGTAPQVDCELIGGTGAATAMATAFGITAAAGTTSCALQMHSMTPVAGSTYQFRVRVIG